MGAKQRLSASVDREILSAARAAVQAGRADNISAWVNEALHRHAEHDRRMQALDDFVQAYESVSGSITDQEMFDAERSMRARAIVERGARRGGARKSSITPSASRAARKVAKRR